MAAARGGWKKLKTLLRLQLGQLLNPVIGLQVGLTDPVCGLGMGQTAENLVREFAIPRTDQDLFALESHQRAVKAEANGFFHAERMRLALSDAWMDQDQGPKADISAEYLAKKRPAFDKACGTVTSGNTCPITDGAAAVLLMREEDVGDREVIGYLSQWTYAGCDNERMGLGPVYALAQLRQRYGINHQDVDLIEINEAFAAQVLGCLAAADSDEFGRKELGLSGALGTIDRDKLNIHGGAIALGHPVGTTGMRLVITLLQALRQAGKQRGIASLCIGGGQGAALLLEVA